MEGLHDYHARGIGWRPKVLQTILRHSDIAVTLSFYVETQDSESREALDKPTELMKS
jgi:hypothetical protein